jgi:cation:H+ antiporter
LEWVELVFALILILAAAELFTNGVEWIGQSFGLSDGAVGSVLAAVGTALPETLLPLVAILLGRQSGDEIGVGAILGAPFMLTTLAMFVLGASVLLFSRGGRRSTDLMADGRVLSQDLGYFLVMYTLAMVAGLFHHTWFKWGLVVVLMVGYAFYVKRHFESPAEATQEAEARGEIAPLYFGRLLGRVQARRRVPVVPAAGAAPMPGGVVGTAPALAPPAVWLSVTQTTVGLVGIVGGARIFVLGIDRVSEVLHVPHLALALLLAPLATELPEKFNSVIWARRRKDTLALGNLTGAMVFQSSFPVTVGLLLTPWRLSGESLVAALVALGAGSVLWVTLKVRGRLAAKLLLLQGIFYAGYVTYVLARL